MGSCKKMVPLFSAIIKIKNGSPKMKSIMHMHYGSFGSGKPLPKTKEKVLRLYRTCVFDELQIGSVIYRTCDM